MTVKLSPKYQVVIPKEVRDPPAGGESMDLKPGAEFNVFQYGDRIELVPVQDIRELRGFAKGIDTTVERDEDRV